SPEGEAIGVIPHPSTVSSPRSLFSNGPADDGGAVAVEEVEWMWRGCMLGITSPHLRCQDGARYRGAEVDDRTRVLASCRDGALGRDQRGRRGIRGLGGGCAVRPSRLETLG